MPQRQAITLSSKIGPNGIGPRAPFALSPVSGSVRGGSYFRAVADGVRLAAFDGVRRVINQIRQFLPGSPARS